MKLLAAVALFMLAAPTTQAQNTKSVLLVGGGGSHDFVRWYGQEDAKTITQAGGFDVQYTEQVDSIIHYLKKTDILILANNQPIGDAGQRAITKFVEKGKPLILMHAAVWYNWEDWPAYNLHYVGGGSKSHEPFQKFKNYVVNNAHPITKGVSQRFDFKDELYRHESDPTGPGVEVLAIGQSLETDAVYPTVFTVKHPKAKIVGITLGHDAHSHEHEAYRTLLVNAVKWVSE